MSKIHPIACIQQAKQNFEYGSDKPIKTRVTPAHFTSIKSDIKNRINQFDRLTKASLVEHSLETDIELLGFQEIAKRDILHSAIDPNFLQKYSDDIEFEKTFDGLLQFISEIIGTQTEKQRISEAKAKLESISRNIEDEERFVRFLDKLKRIAEPISKNSEIKQYLITDAFNKNLNRPLRTFLHEHEKSDESIENIAAYLDRMQKYKHSHINQIDVVAAKKMDELCEQNQRLQTQNISIEEKLDSLKKEMQKMIVAAVAQSTMEINRIETTEKQPVKTYQPEERQYPNKDQRYHRQRFNPKWEVNKFGVPITCNKCGWKGHQTKNCLGLIRCVNCSEQGHAITICPKLKTSLNSKNE